MGLEMSALGTSAVGTSALGMSALGVLHATRWCAGCADERAFEMPPCEDDHGGDCLDLACVECGHAIVVGIQAAEEIRVVEFAAA